jgi:hypothetical protein
MYIAFVWARRVHSQKRWYPARADAVPFASRAKIFHERVALDRAERQRDMDGDGLHGRWIRVRRNYLFEDALERLSALGEGIKDRLRVQFVDLHGMEEAGIDGGYPMLLSRQIDYE